MSEFLRSVKDDLTDRRLLPLVVLVAVVLVGALAYAALSGGSGSTPTALVTPAPPPSMSGLSATVVQTSAGQAVAETTNGASVQRQGSAHDPFTELPGTPKASSAASVATSTSSSSTTSSTGTGSTSKSSSESSSQGSGGSTSPAPAKPKTPAKPTTIFRVAAEFGAIPAGAVVGSTQLHRYPGLTKATPLPSAKEKVVEFLGVTVSGANKSAAFALTGEVILHGPGACLPSATECKLIDLKEGKSEQLEYLSLSGQPVVYELRVVSITSTTASSASVKGVLSAQGKAARTLLGGRLLSMAGLHFSAQAGVLVFAAHRARAGAARRGPRR